MTGVARIAAFEKRSTSSRSHRKPERSEPVRYADAARNLLRDTIISAVDRLARIQGWSATTMSHVAEAAGVSRQTIYNEFGSRHALVEAYVTREIEVLVNETERVVREHSDDPHGAVRSAFILFFELASDEPVIQILEADADGGDLARLLTTVGRDVATGRIAGLITDIWPQVSRSDATLVAESLVRLAISHALLPTSDPHATADDITRLVSPFITMIVGEPHGGRTD